MVFKRNRVKHAVQSNWKTESDDKDKRKKITDFQPHDNSKNMISTFLKNLSPQEKYFGVIIQASATTDPVDYCWTRCWWQCVASGEPELAVEEDVRNLVRGAGTGGTTTACIDDLVLSARLYVPGSKTGGYSSSPTTATGSSLGVSEYVK